MPAEADIACGCPENKSPALKQVVRFWQRPADSRSSRSLGPSTCPSISPIPISSILYSSRRRPETKNPACFHTPGFLFWRRPTLARPIAVLPSGLQRFTAVFGMGTGGATALVSPESEAGLAVRRLAASKPKSNSGDDVDLSKNCRFSDIYIQEVKANI